MRRVFTRCTPYELHLFAPSGGGGTDRRFIEEAPELAREEDSSIVNESYESAGHFFYDNQKREPGEVFRGQQSSGHGLFFL